MMQWWVLERCEGNMEHVICLDLANKTECIQIKFLNPSASSLEKAAVHYLLMSRHRSEAELEKGKWKDIIRFLIKVKIQYDKLCA